MIRKVRFHEDQDQKSKKYYLPKDIISFKGFSEKHPKDIVKYLASRMMFVTDKLIRIITFGGMDCLFDVSNKTEDSDQANLRLVSFTKLDNYATGNFNVENHAILEKLPLPLEDVFERLLRKTHAQKAWIDQFKHLIKRGKDDSNYSKRVSRLFGVDYNLNPGVESNAFIAELSFTVLDWIILDKIKGKKPFTLKDIDDEQQLQLSFNIYPGGQTILHKLASKAQAQMEGTDAQGEESYNQQQAVKDLFDKAKAGIELESQYFESGQPLHIPILKDAEGDTAIDVAMGLAATNSSNKLVTEGAEENEDEEEADDLVVNMEMALVLFECIKDYPTLHSTPYLVRSIITAVQKDLPGIGDFLDARMRKYEGMHVPTTQGKIRTTKTAIMDQIKGKGPYGVQKIDIVGGTQELQTQLFTQGVKDKQMTFQLLDVPRLYTGTKSTRDFIRVLGRQNDTELFSHPSIQKIINYHWKSVKYYVWGFQFFPLLLQMIIFTYWHI